MLTMVLLSSPFAYFILYNIFSNAHHFKYAQTIAKHEGFWNFFQRYYVPINIMNAILYFQNIKTMHMILK